MQDNSLEEKQAQLDLIALVEGLFSEVRKYWWLLIVMMLLGGTFFLVRSVTSYSPMYRSQASFTVMFSSQSNADSSATYDFRYDSETASQLGATFPYILSSELLQDAIKEDLDIQAVNGSISASVVPDSNLITMEVVSSDAGAAKAILESAIRCYPDVARFVIGNIKFNMIDMPELAAEPYNMPSYPAETAKGAVFGLVLGFVILILLALCTKTVRRTEELTGVINLTCLGKIPEVRRKARRNQTEQRLNITEEHTDSGLKENIRGLQMKVCRKMDEREAKILIITSTAAEEGKSMIAVNLACAMAEHGKRVLLIDCDLRKQTDWKYFGETSGKGLQDILSGACSADEAVSSTAAGIRFLGGKEPAENSSEILNSPKMKETLDHLAKEVDYVILDAPPCEIFEDASVLSEYADAVLYVVRYDYVQRQRIQEALTELDEGSARVIGYAFNGVKMKSRGYGYRYGYGYGYSYGYGYGKYGHYGAYGEKKNAQEDE